MSAHGDPSFDLAATLTTFWIQTEHDGTLHRFDSVALLADERVEIVGVAHLRSSGRHVEALWRVRLPSGEREGGALVDILWRDPPDLVAAARTDDARVRAARLAVDEVNCLRELSAARAAFRDRTIDARRAAGRSNGSVDGPPSETTLQRILAEARVIDCTRRAEAVLTAIALRTPCVDGGWRA